MRPQRKVCSGNFLRLVQASLLHQECQGTGLSILQGQRDLDMIRRDGFPLRLLLLAIGLAELDRVDASRVFCLKVEGIVASNDERILISGCQLPLLLASRLKFVGRAR